MEKTLEERAKKIKLLILDVDGVLTDGRLIYDNSGEELKCFNVQDGFGMTLLHNVGIIPIIITAKKSRLVSRRAREMGVFKVYQNAIKKLESYENVLREFKLSDEEICFIGDDLIDLPVLKRVGLAVAVVNAVQEVKDIAHYVTQKEGGKGAVREAIELILRTQGRWGEATKSYLIDNHQ